MRWITKLLLTLSICASSVPALASSVYLRMDHTPYNAGRYTIAVSQEPTKGSQVRFTVVVKLKEGKWPMRLTAKLSKIFQKPGSLTVYDKRELKFQQAGMERRVTFTVSRKEAEAWCCEVDEYGEAGGHLMPSISAFYFHLNRVPAQITD